MTRTRRLILSAATSVALLATLPAAAQPFITLASTTSTENSGLFGHILPIFSAETGSATSGPPPGSPPKAPGTCPPAQGWVPR